MAQFEQIRREQCEATETIRSRYGERAALEYLVGEKLLLFTSTARTRPEFAAQLPAFVAHVNRPGFTGEFFVQNLRDFFKGVHACIELLLYFLRRFMANCAVQPFGIVPADSLQGFPLDLAH